MIKQRFLGALLLLANCAGNFNAANAQEPGSELALRAFGLVNKGQFEEAAALANQALQINPKLAPAYYVIGEINFKRKQYDAAELHYRKAILYFPQFAPPIADLGRIKWERDKDAAAAIALLTHSLEYSKTDDTVFGYRASLYEVQKKYDLAIADLTHAIELTPRFAHYYERRAKVKFLAGEEKSAIADMGAAINLDGKGETYVERGTLYFFSNQLTLAISDFQTAAAKDSKYKGLAEAVTAYKLFKEDKLTEAEKLILQFPKERTLIDNFVRGHFALAQTRWSTAGWYFEKVLQDSPRFPAAYADRALLKASFDKDFKGALSDISTALSYRKEPDFYLTRAAIYIIQGNEALALSDISSVRKLDPTNKFAMRVSAGMHYKNKKFTEALADCDQLVNNKATARDYVFRGFILLHMSKLDEASNDFKKALELDTDYSTAHYGLAAVSMNKKDDKQALEQINLAIKSNPSDDRFIYLRAQAYMLKHDYNHAYTDFARLIKADKTDIKALMGAAVANFQMSNNDVAKQYLDAILRISANNQEALYLRALVAKHSANYSAAITDCDAVAKLCATETTGKWSELHCISQGLQADALMHMGKYKEAIEKCKSVLANAGNSPSMDSSLRSAISKVSKESESMLAIASKATDSSVMVKAAGDYIAKSDPKAQMLDGLFKHQFATKRFLFLSNRPEPRILYYAKFAESFLDFIDRDFIKLKNAPLTRVYIVENHKDFLDFVFHHFPEEHEARAAFFSGPNAIVFGDEDGIEVFAHEIMHKVVFDNMTVLDRWAREGVSVFFEQIFGYYDNDKLVLKLGFISPTRSRVLTDELPKVKLDAILHEKDVTNHEAEVGLVSFFLNEDNKFKPYLEVARLNGLGKANSLLEAVYGKPVGELEPQWSEFLKKLVANRGNSSHYMKSQIFDSKADFDEAEKHGFIEEGPDMKLLPTEDFKPAIPQS